MDNNDHIDEVCMKDRTYREDSRTRQTRVIPGLMGLAMMASAMMFIRAVPVHAQSTSGAIHGQAPAGDVVIARSDTGLRRKVVVGDSGKFKLRRLPLGVYSVTLEKDGKVVDKYHRVPLTVGRGMEVNFACPHDHCAAAK
jgi:hypothetical protein